MRRLSIVLCFVFVISAVNSNSNPEVEINDGKLQGKFMVTRTGRKFSGFLAIPFAKPPLGELRFEVSDVNLISLTDQSPYLFYYFSYDFGLNCCDY